MCQNHTRQQEAMKKRKLRAEVKKLKSAMSKGFRNVAAENAVLKLMAEVKKENKDLHMEVNGLTLEIESLQDENEKLKAKVALLTQQVNKWRMSTNRKEKKIEEEMVKAKVAKDEYGTDKEASYIYYNEIVTLLQKEVDSGKKTQIEMETEMEGLKKLETKDKGKYSAKVRLLYYDLLSKGVSCKIVKPVVQSVLQHLTQVGTENVSLPSRSSAQRMVLEAGELAKVKTAYEMMKNPGPVGHHSDGTTKGQIHWGLHVLKLSVDGESKSFTLCAEPLPSGRAQDTVLQLENAMGELYETAEKLHLDPTDQFSFTRILSRMSDRANVERCVTKLIRERKENEMGEATEGLHEDTVYEYTCASHKVHNMASAMTQASAGLLYAEGASGNQKRGLVGAKKQIYEVNKLICVHSRKEYSTGKQFKMFCLEKEVFEETGAHLLAPIVGNWYLVYLMNATPTLVSKEMLMVYLQYIKESRDQPLNQLELSVWNSYMSENVQAELCAFSLMHYFVCQPLLSCAKSAKSPLQMNDKYSSTLTRLEEIETDTCSLFEADPDVGVTSDMTAYQPYMQTVQRLAKEDHLKEKVCAVLHAMAIAGKRSLQNHALEHLPGGEYYTPDDGAVAAGVLIGSATNDTVESGFGLLDRLHYQAPVRNPMNTSALIMSKRDKPVSFVNKQEPELQQTMVNVARLSATRKRKVMGTADNQLKKLWLAGAEARKLKQEKRNKAKRRRKERDHEVVENLKSGRLITSIQEVDKLKGPQLVEQFRMWTFLKKEDCPFNVTGDLRGHSSTTVAKKKDILRNLISSNNIDTSSLMEHFCLQ